MTDAHTDGNEAAGLLEELLTAEITTVRRLCRSCGTEGPLAEHRAYHGAGLVLRCPACEDVAIRVVTGGAEAVVEVHGLLRIPLAG
jgi:Zn finger protein HypA/HybF involved in hydrogenase expression